MNDIDSKMIWVIVSDIKPNPKNPNSHPPDQIDRLAQILEYQGWRLPLIVSNQTGLLVVGHGRLMAAKKLGMKTVPVSYQDFEDEDQEYAFMVSDNAISEWATLELAQINQDIQHLDGSGFDIDLLGLKDFEIQLDIDEDKQSTDDEVPETQNNELGVKTGEIYQLGKHRIMCGDSTVKENIDKLLDGAKIDMVYTDPPYGMNLDTDFSNIKGSIENKVGSKNNYDRIIGDDKQFDASFMIDMCSEVFLWGADYYTESLKKNGSWVVWDKVITESLGKSIGSNFELCWSKAKHKRDIARIKWSGLYGFENEDTPKRVHPTQKPVKLAEWFFENWGSKTKTVADLFLGSGSTLIACEKTGRTCYGMELDPHYVSVIIKRWEDYTGEKAKKL